MRTLTRKQAENAEKLEKRTVLNLQDPETTDPDRIELELAMLAYLEEDSEDFLTLLVRRGVTYDGYEVLMRDRLLTIKASLVSSAIKNKTLDKLVRGYVERLRSRLFTGQEPVIAAYRVIDVERERLDELEGVLREAMGEPWLKRFLTNALEKIEFNGVDWESPMKVMTKVRLLKQACQEELHKLLEKVNG